MLQECWRPQPRKRHAALPPTRVTTKDVHDRPQDPQAKSIHGPGWSKTGREEERETRIVFERQADGEYRKFRETITWVEVVTLRYFRRADRGSHTHRLAHLYTIGKATDRTETAKVWIAPGPEYATRIRIPWTEFLGLAAFRRDSGAKP